jgi:hypothetical protein
VVIVVVYINIDESQATMLLFVGTKYHNASYALRNCAEEVRGIRVVLRPALTTVPEGVFKVDEDDNECGVGTLLKNWTQTRGVGGGYAQ